MSSVALNQLFFPTKDVTHLEKVADKYPWCSVAQLSLLLHYKKNSLSSIEKQVAKTALFFSNTQWLNWQLHQLTKEDAKGNKEESLPQHLNEVEQNEKIVQSISEIDAASDTKETEIEFEPLHTTDYFASQGIKLTDEPVTNDKLGTQLKSFTEWLKSMKKIHKEKLAEGDDQTDKTIQQIAEHSNADAEIVTEAMADVLVKQEKHEKAIEVYRKLSLLNPSKSAYFAAQIDRLKTL